MTTGDAELDRLIGVKPKRSRAGCIGWVLFVIVAVLAGLAVKYLYLPMRKSTADLNAKIADSDAKLKDLESKLNEAKEAQTKVAGERDQLPLRVLGSRTPTSSGPSSRCVRQQ